jgi:3-dehydroquinate synthetase
VVIDVDVLDTLPLREYRAGLAEVVKYGVIQDAEFFAFLEANVEPINSRDHAVLTSIIERCCRLKADVVEQDEREETGLRAILNYGHTFGHAFEAATGYEELLHGEGVAMGMMCAARLAQRIGRVDAAFVDRQRVLLKAFGLPLDAPDVAPNELVELMYRDKKVDRGKLRFVLPSRMGHVECVSGIATADIIAALSPED